MSFRCVFSSINNIDVQLAKSILDSEEIDSHIPNDQITSILPHMALAAGGAQLMVSETDYEIAFEALADFKEQLKNNSVEMVNNDSNGEEDDSDAVLCPSCYSKNIEIVLEPARGPILLIFSLFGIPAPVKKKVYHCKECHRKWK